MVTELLREIAPEKFRDIVLESPKQVREMIFDRLDIKKKQTNSMKFVKPGEKNEERVRALFDKLKTEEDEEVAEELLRNYFLKRRPLLGDALDAIGVPHQEGLTDQELDKFEKMSKAEATKLLASLSAKHDAFDAKLYLKYMKAPI
jgi:hypothetical protein